MTGTRHVDGGSSRLSDVGLGGEQPLVLVMEALALLGQLGLELGLGRGVGAALLLKLLEFKFTGGGGIKALLGESDGLGSEGLVNAGLDGVDLVGLGLTVPSGGGG